MVLGVDAHYDGFTRGGWEYRRNHVYDYMRNRGMDVRLLSGELAEVHRVHGAATRPEVVYLTGVGHGLADRYKGHGGQNLLRVGRYAPEVARGRIVHFAACDTSLELGPDLVAKGCRAFFGYSGKFHYPSDEEENEILDKFFECDSEIDRCLADGCTAAEAYESAYDRYTHGIETLKRAGRDHAATLLQENRDRLRAPSIGSRWGDQNARLFS